MVSQMKTLLSGLATIIVLTLTLPGAIHAADAELAPAGIMEFTGDFLTDSERIRGAFTRIVDDDGALPGLNFHFAFALGSARLEPQALQKLDILGDVMRSLGRQGYRFAVNGHTDITGPADLNNRLSLARAEAVAEHLVRKWNVEPAWLRVIGFGSTHLLDPGQPKSAVNRRVEVLVTERPAQPMPESPSGPLTE